MRDAFFEDVINYHTNTKMKGLLKNPKFYNVFYSPEMFSYKIPLHFKFRPDLISYKFYGTAGYDWVLTYVNEFTNSPEDYEVDRTILIPSLDKIKQVL